MSRFGRGAAWVFCWPLGLALSMRHANRRDLKRARTRPAPGPSNPMAVRDLADIFKAHEIPKGERVRMTAAAMQDVHAGVSVVESSRRQLEQWNTLMGPAK